MGKDMLLGTCPSAIPEFLPCMGQSLPMPILPDRELKWKGDINFIIFFAKCGITKDSREGTRDG